jgi:transcriptional regulator of aromatic amino acid metabolism
MAISKARKASKEYATKLWKEFASVTKVARRIGYTETGTLRLLRRFGIRRS